jgi:hypothetical protein
MPGQVLTQHDIEQGIVETSDRLAELTEEYAVLCEVAAEAEADYRLHFYNSLMRLKDAGDGKRMTDKEAEARSTSAAAADFRNYKMTAARLDAAKQALATHRTRLDALRTLAANVRAVTTA